MTRYAELEIRVNRSGAWVNGEYFIDMRFDEPGRDTPISPLRDGPQPIHIDLPTLLAHEADSGAYGQQLSAMFFAKDTIRTAFAKVRAASLERDPARLRVRLNIGADAVSLHNIRWETLRDPEDPKKTLMTDESILFSRFIVSSDWRGANNRPRQQLRALIAVANPNNLEEYGLAKIDVDGETRRAQNALGSRIPSVILEAGGIWTIDHLFAELKKGYDILYLVAHGQMSKRGDEAVLHFEDETGNVVNITGEELVHRFAGMWERPRLIVLAACESGGTGIAVSNELTLATLGPRLAREGIPAVLAMQGKITIKTIERFMPEFFSVLSKDGEIDTAVATARNHVQKEDDWWAPVLYMRLQSGRINWYTAGFTDENRVKWPTLIQYLKLKTAKCTPILGTGLAESLFGSRRELAQAWAKKHHFPLAPDARDDLPQVAQYLDIAETREFLLKEFVEYLCTAIRLRHKEYLDKDLLEKDLEEMDTDELIPFLDELIQAVWNQHQAINPYDPYCALARLNIPIYITTAPSNLLANALRLVGKEPHVEHCPWRGNIATDNNGSMETGTIEVDEYEPTVDEPLVYHLFGRLQVPDSLVLTEDDYFDYLIGITRHNTLIPKSVRATLINKTLLILGLPFDSWESRILFRVMMRQGGSHRMGRNAHVAAQVAPREPNVLKPAEARKYLENYFLEGSINIFWGKPEDFIQILQSKLKGGTA